MYFPISAFRVLTDHSFGTARYPSLQNRALTSLRTSDRPTLFVDPMKRNELAACGLLSVDVDSSEGLWMFLIEYAMYGVQATAAKAVVDGGKHF